MQHDTTTYNKVVKPYKLFLYNKCCTLLYEKLGSFDRGLTFDLKNCSKDTLRGTNNMPKSLLILTLSGPGEP